MTNDDGSPYAARFQRDLYLYWRAAERFGSLPLTSRGYVTRPALRRIRARIVAADGMLLPEGDAPEAEDLRLLFLRRLLERLGLLRAPKSRLLVAEREAAGRYFFLPLGERVRLCLRAWVAGGWWPDRHDVRAPLPSVMSPAPPRVALARRSLLDALAGAEPDAALLPGSTVQPASTARGGRGGRDKRRITASPALDASIWQAALEGPMRWMGLVAHTDDASKAKGAAGGHYALGGMAALVAGREQESLAERHGRVIVQSNFEIIAYPPLTAPALLALDTCAEEVAFGQLCRYRLTAEALSRARSAGWSATEVARRLAALAGASPPPNVEITLRDWERRGERLQLTPDAVVLDVDDAAILDQLAADPVAMRWVERRLGPTSVLLVPGSEIAARAWLLRRSHLPALTREAAGEQV